MGAVPQKIQTGGWGHEISKGIEKNTMWKFQVSQKRSKIHRGDWEEIMWNFCGSWFLLLEISKVVTKFCGI